MICNVLSHTLAGARCPVPGGRQGGARLLSVARSVINQPLILSPAASESSSQGAQRQVARPDPQAVCPRCGGTRVVSCLSCIDGRLRHGGWHAKNTIVLSRIVGSKWTAMQRTLGWRHFHVTDRRKAGCSGEILVLLIATCDSSAKLWLNSSVLKSRSLWSPGWLQKEEIAQADSPGPECKVCSGRGSHPCLRCSSGGATVQL